MDVEDVVKEVDVGGFGGAGAEVAGVKLEALLLAESGGEVRGEASSPPPDAPGAVCAAGCSTSAYRHTGQVPLVFSHIIMQSSWKS